MTGNLPSWPGADVVYARADVIASELARREYAAWCKRKRPRKSDRFSVSPTIGAIVDAMNTGDEETLKAFVAEYLDIALHS